MQHIAGRILNIVRCLEDPHKNAPEYSQKYQWKVQCPVSVRVKDGARGGTVQVMVVPEVTPRE